MLSVAALLQRIRVQITRTERQAMQWNREVYIKRLLLPVPLHLTPGLDVDLMGNR